MKSKNFEYAHTGNQRFNQKAQNVYTQGFLYRVTQKNGNFWKTQQKLKKAKKKNLLTEIEPLQLAF